MDIIELSLLQFTDFKKFECLATELMRREGFSSIRPIGGIGDDGVDAEEVLHYQDETGKTVFQYSLQTNVSSKITETIKKLRDNGVDFDNLYIVTNQQVNNKQNLRKKARENHNISLQIIDLSDLKVHLGEDELLYNRYFPHIDAQIAALRNKPNILSEESADALEKSMLKCSLIFSIRDTQREKHQRNHLFYQTILSVVAITEEGKTKEEISSFFLERYNRIINAKEIDNALAYLIGEDWLHKDQDRFRASNKVTRSMLAGIADIERKTDCLINEIITSVAAHCGEEKVSKEKGNIITDNIKQVLNIYFRLYGTEFCGGFNADSEQILPDLVKVATKDLSDNLAEWTVYFLGQLFSRPTREQSETLSLWAKCFMGMQLMKLDPMLGEFQLEKLRGKTFVLDTDFVLYSITDSCKESMAYKQIIEVLLHSGCNVVIPDEIVREVANHAASAEANYRYFKSVFCTISEEVVEEEMNNIFVKDYYLKVMRKEISDLAFPSYLENYYEENDKVRFMSEVIGHKLKGVRIGGDFTTHGVISETEKYEFVDSINEELMKTPKAKHRSEADNYELSRVDADLYLYVLGENKDMPNDQHGNLLRGSHYLLTNSTRSSRCAKKLGFHRNVVTNPTLIYNLIDEIGFFRLKNKSSVLDLFANPFLAHIVSENWDLMKGYADRGVDLKGREIPRLKRDLDGVIHSKLTTTEDESIQQDEISGNDMVDFIAFAQEIDRRGYRLVPSVQKQIDAFREKQKTIDEMGAQLDAVTAAIEKKSKRQRNYLNNVKNRAKSKRTNLGKRS
ncbi:MAG: hypothetical protein IJ588_03840 [Prevotella sp.]|nr:hypothetical protein [Prevotella sp.]